MAENTIRKFKWFWAWQDEQEEAWLRSMSQKGWHLSSVSVGLPGIYRFRAGEPQDYVYRLDYQTHKKEAQQDYLQLFSDAGWEHLGEMSGWHYFRKEAKEGESLEIYTDVESKVAKYKRVLTVLGFFYIMLIAVSPYLWWGAIQAIQVITLLVLLFFTYAIIRLAIRLRQLRSL